MSDLRLADLIEIVKWLALVFGASSLVFLLIAAWPQLRLFWQGTTWRLTPALRSWAEENKHRAVKRYAPNQSYDMSRYEDWEEEEEGFAVPLAPTATTQQQPIATPTTDSKALLLEQQAATLAKLVKAGVVGETKGLQIVFDVRPSSTNPRYLAARDALKAELAKLDPNPKYRLTPEQEAAREALGLSK